MNRKKLEITKLVLNLLKNKQGTAPLIPADYDESKIDTLMPVWWIGGRTTDSMQLTSEGFISFRHAEIEYHIFDLGKNLLEEYSLPQVYRTVNGKITNPFYLNLTIKNNYEHSSFLGKLVLFDSKDAVYLTLKGGTVYDLMK